jgi:FkbM family methyltransferase
MSGHLASTERWARSDPSGRATPPSLSGRGSIRAWLGGVRDRVRYVLRLRRAGFTFEVLPDRLVLARRGSLRLKCRILVGDDLGHLEEVFCRRAYGGDFSRQVVVDVGMSSAETTVYFALMGASKVVGVEPAPDSFGLALENIALNHVVETVRPLNVAVAGQSGFTDLVVSRRNPNANSLAPSDAVREYIRFDRTVRVPTITLGELFQHESLERVDFLKIDCEGAEYDMIRALSRPDAERVRRIVLEFHDGPRDLPEILTRLGFEVRWENQTPAIGILTAERPSSPVAGTVPNGGGSSVIA